jgi:hypothetical protein
VSARAASRVAWSACGLTLAVIACSLVLGVLNQTDNQDVFFVVALVSCVAVGGLVASRQPRNPVGWFFLASAACFALQSFALQYALYGLQTDPGSLPAAKAMAWVQTWVWAPGVMLLLSFLPLYFPDGRLISRHWRWVVGSSLLVSLALTFQSALLPGDSRGTGLVNPLGVEALEPLLEISDLILFAPYFAVLFASAASIVVRFRRSSGEERQQIKWLAYTVSALPVWFLVNPLIVENPLLVGAIDALLFAGIPVATGVAILRYRLYDIDRIINRTLVYGVLTVTLILVYLGGAVLLEALFRALAGQGSQLSIVASTLVIAALFGPLRRRIQGLIDRRFYRGKYDAARTLAEFNARLRDETDLGDLSEDLIRVVRETMQPEHVSLWLRAPMVDRMTPR